LRNLTSIKAWVQNWKEGKKEGFGFGFERKQMEKRNNR